MAMASFWGMEICTGLFVSCLSLFMERRNWNRCQRPRHMRLFTALGVSLTFIMAASGRPAGLLRACKGQQQEREWRWLCPGGEGEGVAREASKNNATEGGSGECQGPPFAPTSFCVAAEESRCGWITWVDRVWC